MRNNEDQVYLNLCGRYSDCIDSAVDLACNAYGWLMPRNAPDYYSSPFSLYRSMIERADACSVLVRAGSTETCSYQIRGIFEAELMLMYMLSANLKVRARLFAYCRLRDGLRAVKRISSSESESIVVKRDLEHDSVLSSFASLKDHSVVIAEYESMMNGPKYSAIKTKYIDPVSKNNRAPWYQFDGGATSIEQLARMCGYGGRYEFLYRDWSKTVHVQNASDGVVHSQDSSGIRPIRLPCNNIGVVVQYATASLTHGMILLMDRVGVGQEIRQRLLQQYEQDVSPKIKPIYQEKEDVITVRDPK